MSDIKFKSQDEADKWALFANTNGTGRANTLLQLYRKRLPEGGFGGECDCDAKDKRIAELEGKLELICNGIIKADLYLDEINKPFDMENWNRHWNSLHKQALTTDSSKQEGQE